MIIDGKKFAQELRNEIKKEIESIKKTRNTTPGLTVVLVGNHTPSEIYVRNKELSAKEVGITSEVIRFESSITQEKLIEVIHGLNKDKKVHGILVQLPLPPHINGSKIIEEIDPKKDVDGFHPVNVGNLSSGKDSLVPCTPLGSYLLIKNVQKNLTGLEALIIGRSNLNGKPMAQLLLKEDCTVTIGHSKTKNLKELCQKADIVVAAVGRANLVKGDWVKEGAIVIDVGINREEDKTEKKGYKIVGDVEFDSVVKKARAITPVPGGVGPMTIACLLNNTLKAFKNIN
ncbi:MAG: bifunctional methylenetetrahydrofolate dehydrogenase/methenyltetrahydrofolate cyclohydrolase FolD [Proteobacteria bacterium]|nr:bifunctional methylenetetrahydrofolate dehydrogenase/methenyltetrahydrofolate cyclohydrolase FolD [Alphaproteobacteria bacterium]NBV93072.1 bifunctional methylenetetrahydrofolate dehydrogenase/methenyltetrahydrofolate cyclohydrolase FolD [Candidatus Fonsibacter sp. PEL4]NBZ97628.1 bifunctional methylenetetrahydrofolate dehydrogenase/methenyltetrahydrofolate cyclohydrolase FolD [Candidatus Fonsibacter sp. PEL4]